MVELSIYILTVIIRIVGDFHDGLSSRRLGVSWLTWHLVNWLRRDLIITVIIWHIIGSPWVSLGNFINWIMLVGINILFHKVFYYLGEIFSEK